MVNSEKRDAIIAEAVAMWDEFIEADDPNAQPVPYSDQDPGRTFSALVAVLWQARRAIRNMREDIDTLKAHATTVDEQLETARDAIIKLRNKVRTLEQT